MIVKSNGRPANPKVQAGFEKASKRISMSEWFAVRDLVLKLYARLAKSTEYTKAGLKRAWLPSFNQFISYVSDTRPSLAKLLRRLPRAKAAAIKDLLLGKQPLRKCFKDGCTNTVIRKGGYCCSYCRSQCPKDAQKRTESLVRSHGVSNAMFSDKCKASLRRTQMKKFGGHPMFIKEIADKVSKKNSEFMMNGGYDALKESMIRLHGVDHWTKIPGVYKKALDKIEQKTGERKPYFATRMGIEQAQFNRLSNGYSIGPLGNSESQAKYRKTNTHRIGYDNPSKDPNIKQIKKDTTFNNYGYEHGMQSPVVRARARITSLSNSGVPHGSAVSRNAKTLKKTIVDGKTFVTEGYEHLAIEYLVSEHNVPVENIDTVRTVKRWFELSDGSFSYPDLWVNSKPVEVKSVHYFISGVAKLKRCAVEIPDWKLIVMSGKNRVMISRKELLNLSPSELIVIAQQRETELKQTLRAQGQRRKNYQ